MASTAALNGFLKVIRSEQEKRAKQRGFPISEEECRRQFYEELDLMHERMLADPNYREPTPEEQALAMQDLERYFRSLSK